MGLPDLMALVLGLSLTAYAIFAGADFGAGILDLLAGHRTSDRAAIARTIGPLWEANHVWLIFSITILFSAFPAASAALGTALLAPLTLALLAIVLRGVAFGLRSSAGAGTPSQIRLSGLFGGASVAAPFLFGLVAGALAQASTAIRPASGAVPPIPASGAVPPIPWTGLFAVSVGALAVALCAQLAASFMALRLGRAGDAGPAERFRRRGLQAGGAVLVLSVLALGAASWKAPALWHRLTTAALPIIILGLAASAVSLLALARRRYSLARGATVAVGGALTWGWLTAQSPHLIGTALTIHTAAATPAALTAVAIAGGFVLVTVLPAMYLLFRVSARPLPEVIQ
jgi:cytochrome d ubiquinol oxidase subunit II